MDAYRKLRPETDLGLIGGFHAEPLSLLLENRADYVIVSENRKQPVIAHFPLFRYPYCPQSRKRLGRPYARPGSAYSSENR